MAILSNINGKFAVESTGAIQFNGSNGTSGYVLKSNGNTSPTWVDPDTIIGPYLPLSGGTLTGTTSTAAGIAFNVGGNLTVQSGNKLILNRPNNAIDCELSTDSSGTLILNSRNSEGFKFQNNGTNFVTGDSSNNVTFAGNIATAADKRISVGTWDNSAFTGGNAYGFSVTSSLPLLHLTESDQTNKKGYVGLSGGSMYVGGLISNLYLQSGASGTTALTIDSSQNATFAGNVTINGGQILTPGGVNLALNPNTGIVSVGGVIQCSGTGNSTFAGKIVAGGGVQFTGGTIAAATAVLHTNNYLYFRGGTSGLIISGSDGSCNFRTTNSEVLWEIGSAEKMRLNSTGLGIGTTSPSALLDVSSGTTTDVIRFGANSRWGFSRANSDNRYLSFMRNQNGSGTAVWTADGDNGNVGIGTTLPTRQLHLLRTTGDVRGIMVETTVATSYAEVQVKASREWRIGTGGSSTTPAGDFYIYDATEGAHRFDIDDSGNAVLGGGNPTSLSSNTTSLAVNSTRNDLSGAIFHHANGSYKAYNYWDSGGYITQIPSGAGDVRWHINNAERMRILSGGNVGIGTTSPTAKLEVVCANGANAFRANFGSSADIFMGFDNANPYLMLQDNSNVTTHLFQSNVNNYIVGSNLGIGTTTPNEKLVVGTTSGTQNIEISNSFIQSFNRSGSPGYAALGFYASSYTFNVGSVDIHATTGDSLLQFNIDGDTYSMGIDNSDSDKFKISYGVFSNSDILTLDTSLNAVFAGNVGIGTTAPVATYDKVLHIKGTNPIIRIETDNSSGWAYNQFVSPESTWSVGIDAAEVMTWANHTTLGSGHTKMVLKKTGELGIGTTNPQNQFVIKEGSNVDMEFGSETSGCFIQTYNRTSSAWGYLRFITAGAETMRLTTSGNIGIGTTSPSRKLDIDAGSGYPLSIDSTQRYLMEFARSGASEWWIAVDGGKFILHENGVADQFDMSGGTGTFRGDVVAYGSPSDISLKENIKPIKNPLGKIKKLKGVTFDWKQSDSILDIKEDYGFIAQDVQKIIPELVRKNENELLSMRHQGIIPILVEAIKELEARVKELENK